MSTYGGACSTAWLTCHAWWLQVIVAAHKLHNAALVEGFISDARAVFERVEDITDLVPGEWQCEAGVLLRLSNMYPSLLLHPPA